MADSLDQNKPTLFDEFSYIGYWWRPGEDEKISGRVSYSPSTGIKLELAVSSIDDNYDENNIPKQFEIPFKVEIFHGIVSGYPYRITLLQNRATRIGARESTGLVPYFFRSKILLAGQHSSSATEINLDCLEVTFSNLQDWMEIDFVQLKFLKRDYKLFDEIRRFDIPSINSTISLHEWITGPVDSYEHRIRRVNFIRIEPKSPRSLTWFCELISKIRDLISFLSGIPVETKSISKRLALTTRDWSKQLLDVYFQVRPPKVRKLSSQKIPFSLKILDGKDSEVFCSWFDLDEQLLISFNLCLDVINSNGAFPKFDFLALVYSLENYHRYRRKMKTGLVDRLKELNKKLPEYLQSELYLNEEYLEAIEASRDYYSHYDPNIKKNRIVFSSNDLNEAIKRLIPFMAYFLYRELKIDEDRIQNAFKYVKHWGLWQRAWPTPPNFLK